MRNTQTREIKAAVVRKKGGPFQIETLALDEPRPDEVLIRIVATGILIISHLCLIIITYLVIS